MSKKNKEEKAIANENTREYYNIMLGRFSKNTPEYANKRRDEAAGLIDEVHVLEDKYLEVIAGPFDKETADDNLNKLIENGMMGCIYHA